MGCWGERYWHGHPTIFATVDAVRPGSEPIRGNPRNLSALIIPAQDIHLFWQVVVFAFYDAFESTNGVFQGHVFTR